jgi:iron complex outermembrane receptor protein
LIYSYHSDIFLEPAHDPISGLNISEYMINLMNAKISMTSGTNRWSVNLSASNLLDKEFPHRCR